MSSPVATHETQLKYDVFISFRGFDTRENFTSHLHTALVNKGIHAFIDTSFPRGQYIVPSLKQAIKESEVAVIIFSQSYGGSRYCLDELVEILENMDQRGMTVLPVFYHVYPTDVRNQSGEFGAEFRKVKAEFVDEGDKWSKALEKAANISGSVWEEFRPDSTLVDEVIKWVFEKLGKPVSISLPNLDLVGMELHIKEMINLLQMEKKNVLFLGIWGMGGIGKTTCAKALMNKIAGDFENCYFQADVREESGKHPNGFLQNKILGEILNMEKTPNMLSDLDRKRLRQKKVLIILDDVSETKQLETIAGKYDWYGSGSRIIVTSRDKKVLENGDCVCYKVGGLSEGDALQLFRSHAFKSSSPDKSYEEMTTMALRYAGGVPLALMVLGSLLKKESLDVWKCQLEKLRSKPEQGIHNVLKISYEGLDEDQRKIFLDIACFFKGEVQDLVTDVLNGCGFSAVSGINRLKQKCLITIADDKRLQMHDLIEEMGKNIVREESDDCEMRSRLWEAEEIKTILKGNMDTKSTQSIMLYGNHSDSLFSPPLSLSSMSKLRLLKIRISLHGELPDSEQPPYLPSNLSYLEWCAYPWVSLHDDFYPTKLVNLDLSCSKIERLWSKDKVKVLPQLKRIILWYCRRLKSLPDFSFMVNLEQIILDKCEALHEIPSSIGHLEKLVHLSLSSCSKIISLPNLDNLKSLQTLDLSHCKRLKECPSIDCYTSLRKLDLSFTGAKQLPEYLGNFSALVELNLKSSEIEELPSSIGLLTNLVELNLACCKRIITLPSSILSLSLTVLNLKRTGIVELPQSFGSLSALQRLSLASTDIISLPNNICELKSLLILKLSDCQHIHELPQLEGLHSLTVLDLRYTGIIELPKSVGQLDKLEKLLISNCVELQYLPKLPCSIKFLDSRNCLSMKNVATSAINVIAKTSEDEGDYTFLFSNCIELDDSSRENIMHLLRDDQDIDTTLRQFSTAGKYPGHAKFKVGLPGTTIPKWFRYQSKGTCVEVDFHAFPCQICSIGLVFSVVVGPCILEDVICECNLTTRNEDVLPIRFQFGEYITSDLDHVIIWMVRDLHNSTKSDRDYLKKATFEFSVVCEEFEDEDEDVIKMCGVHVTGFSEKNQCHITSGECSSSHVTTKGVTNQQN